MLDTDSNTITTPRTEPGSFADCEHEDMTKDKPDTDSNAVTTPRTEPGSSVDHKHESITTELTDKEDIHQTNLKLSMLNYPTLQLIGDTTSELSTLNQTLELALMNLPVTDTTNIDLL